jgi:hypothetical protein
MSSHYYLKHIHIRHAFTGRRFGRRAGCQRPTWPWIPSSMPSSPSSCPHSAEARTHSFSSTGVYFGVSPGTCVGTPLCPSPSAPGTCVPRLRSHMESACTCPRRRGMHASARALRPCCRVPHTCRAPVVVLRTLVSPLLSCGMCCAPWCLSFQGASNKAP